MAHERTREILWQQRQNELLRIQDIDAELEKLHRHITKLGVKRTKCLERARHFEIAAVTLDMKDTPS